MAEEVIDPSGEATTVVLLNGCNVCTCIPTTTTTRSPLRLLRWEVEIGEPRPQKLTGQPA